MHVHVTYIYIDILMVPGLSHRLLTHQAEATPVPTHHYMFSSQLLAPRSQLGGWWGRRQLNPLQQLRGRWHCRRFRERYRGTRRGVGGRVRLSWLVGAGSSMSAAGRSFPPSDQIAGVRVLLAAVGPSLVPQRAHSVEMWPGLGGEKTNGAERVKLEGAAPHTRCG